MGTIQDAIQEQLSTVSALAIITTPIEGVLLMEPRVFQDDRGYFLETFHASTFGGQGIGTFVQDNESSSMQGVIRGLHLQLPPNAQGKLVRVVHGAALDVAVDLRKGSPTFGRHVAIELSAANKRMLWIPPGFAHGFEALEDHTVFLYKVTDYYNPASEAGIRFDDPELGIPWRTRTPLVSGKDRILPSFREFLAQHPDAFE
jgi:dTDP-4-dehydrorhamnose 3,5-epimerase